MEPCHCDRVPEKKNDTLFTDPGLRSMTSFMVMPGAVSMVSSKGKALCLRELPSGKIWKDEPPLGQQAPA